MSMRTQLPKLLGLAALAFSAVGCTVRFKGVESFNSATTPVKYTSSLPKGTPGKWEGDPYSFGGTANGSGGLNPGTNYGAGARKNVSDPIHPDSDQPAKGTGQQPGEFHVDQGNGFGQTNSPIAQPDPGSVNSLPSRR